MRGKAALRRRQEVPEIRFLMFQCGILLSRFLAEKSEQFLRPAQRNLETGKSFLGEGTEMFVSCFDQRPILAT